MRTYRAALTGSGVGRDLRRNRFIRNGEFREPQKHEFYISGAVPEVYRAPNDLKIKYHIAVLEKGNG
jgi:hypothetical protein